MILKKLVVGPYDTNSYIFGSSTTKEVVIIDPGGNSNKIIHSIKDIDAKTISILLTHTHFDHTGAVDRIKQEFNIPVLFNKKECELGMHYQKEADDWLDEGDTISIGEITLNVLETPGHSPGSLSFFSSDIKEYKGREIDGIIFTGDLIFQRGLGSAYVDGGDPDDLFSSLSEKIIQNPNFSDNYLIFPGHMGEFLIGDKRRLGMFQTRMY